MAGNLLKGRAYFADWDIVEKNPHVQVLDVRESSELMAYALPRVIHIPLGELRSRLSELDKTRETVIFCTIGVRAYNASRMLMQNGFEKVCIYPGGTRFYSSTHYIAGAPVEPEAPVADSGNVKLQKEALPSIKLDCSGLQCPGPIMKVFESVKEMKDGQELEIYASDPGFLKDIDSWCSRTGNTLISTEKRGNEYIALIKKGNSAMSAIPEINQNDGKTIVVFSGDLDKVIASFIIANGAAAMGRPVTMFFTFWGLNVLRRDSKEKVDKSFVEAMFGTMMPRGSEKLKLSKMNMGGMGTAMMKKVMKDKNVDSLKELIKKAMGAGVKLVACTMSMDVMGIKPEELIDGVELGGVGAYLGDAEQSNVNLFI